MSLAHLVLGLVVRRPDHGYRLHARIGAELGLPELAEPTHVYAALAALERAGLVEGWEERASGRMRRTFAATDAGRARLATWLGRPCDDRSPLRRPLLLRAAVWLHLGERPEPRTLGAERAARLRRIGARTCPAQAVLANLLRVRERRHLEVELWLLDRLASSEAAETPTPARAVAAVRPSSRPTGSGSR